MQVKLLSGNLQTVSLVRFNSYAFLIRYFILKSAQPIFLMIGVKSSLSLPKMPELSKLKYKYNEIFLGILKYE